MDTQVTVNQAIYNIHRVYDDSSTVSELLAARLSAIPAATAKSAPHRAAAETIRNQSGIQSIISRD